MLLTKGFWEQVKGKKNHISKNSFGKYSTGLEGTGSPLPSGKEAHCSALEDLDQELSSGS